MDRNLRSADGSRALALRLIRVNGTLSRVELARQMGLTVAAMTNLVRSLLAEGLIEEAGSSGNTGGKPRTLFRIREDAAYAIGVSVDLHKTYFAIVNLRGTIVHRIEPAESGQGVVSIVDAIVAGVNALIADSDVPADRIVGIGIAGQGPHDRSMAGPAVAGPYADQWLSAEVGDQVSERLRMSVMMQNDANAVASGEFSISPDARASGNFACIYLGQSGLGSGIFADRQLVLGRNSYAGAIAHLSINVDGPECYCGNRGCLELYAAPPAIIDRVRSYDRSSPELAVGVSPKGPGTAADIERVYASARSGHAFAAALMAKVAQDVAAASATMATLLDLDLIVFSGDGFASLEDAFLDAAHAVSDRFASAGARPTFAVRMTVLGQGNEAAAAGAAIGLLDSSFARATGMPSQEGLVEEVAER